ncbi:MAG: hypothetical protein KI788_09770, partial [Mameliella sp.]|nr:hypothetical protein [Mameliella sp.]
MSGLHTPSKADREAFAQRIEGLVGKHGQPAFERVMLDQILTTAENVHVTIFDRTMRANLHTPPTGRG